VLLVVLIAAAVAVFFFVRKPFPSDRTPEGAYMRIAQSVAEERVADAFAYLETDAQHASFTIRDMRKEACDLIRKSYPAPEQKALLAAYEPEANAPDGPDVFALEAKKKGFVNRLRKDLSGVVNVEIDGERASVVTARGTRYPFRRRDNGIWGLTIFTAELMAESERATRDLALVKSAADDYERSKRRAP
jgi:hypothetical protein